MAEKRAKRKLSAILSADVKGYSRLMGQDEAGTVVRIKEYRALMTDFVQLYHGRVVDSPGDNILAEFASVVDATECAVKIQEDLKARNAELPESRRMEFRIGINLGDVIEDSERIYGDGVNIAARIESLAEAGGICISGTSYDQVKNKLNLGYKNLGEHSVKNIAEPVRVYRVLTEPEAAGKVIGEKRKSRKWIALVGRIGKTRSMDGANLGVSHSCELLNLRKRPWPWTTQTPISMPCGELSTYGNGGMTKPLPRGRSPSPSVPTSLSLTFCWGRICTTSAGTRRRSRWLGRPCASILIILPFTWNYWAKSICHWKSMRRRSRHSRCWLFGSHIVLWGARVWLWPTSAWAGKSKPGQR